MNFSCIQHPATSTVTCQVILLNSFCMSPPPRQTSHKHRGELETSVLWDCFLMDLGNHVALFVNLPWKLPTKKKKRVWGRACATLCRASLPYVNVIHQFWAQNSGKQSIKWESICPELWWWTVGDGQKTAEIEYQRWWTKYIKKRGKSITKIYWYYWYYVTVCGRTWQPGKKRDNYDTTLVRLVIDHENNREIGLLNYHVFFL